MAQTDPPKAYLQFAPFPGNCASLDELLRHISRQPVLFKGLQSLVLGYHFGAVEPGPDHRDKPWLKTDKAYNTDGRELGWHVYRRGAWRKVWDAVRGERRTFLRINDDIERDIPDGWVLADGDQELGDDLTTYGQNINISVTGGSTTSTGDINIPNPFFQGNAPNWDTYTCYFVGND